MDFTRMTGRVDNVSDLPDSPVLDGGYTPDRLKEIFDLAGVRLRDYINGVLLGELEATGDGASASEKLGSAPIAGLSGISIRDQLVSLKALCDALEESIRQTAAGNLPAGSVDLDKLSEAVKALLYEKNSRDMVCDRFASPGNYSYTVPRDGLYRIRAVGGGAAGTAADRVGEATGTYDCEGGASGAYGELNVSLTAGTVLSVTVGGGGIPYEDMTEGTTVTETQYLDYLNRRLYHRPGGVTVVNLPGMGEIRAEGGDGENGPARCYFDTLDGAGGFDCPLGRRGLSTRSPGAGDDSFVGQGGAGPYAPPGPGGGGSGGRVYVGSDGSRKVMKEALCGGDGAVIIEHIGEIGG